MEFAYPHSVDYCNWNGRLHDRDQTNGKIKLDPDSTSDLGEPALVISS